MGENAINSVSHADFLKYLSELIEVQIFKTGEELRHQFIWLLMGNSMIKVLSIYSLNENG